MGRPKAWPTQPPDGGLEFVAFLLVQDDEVGHGRGGRRGAPTDEGPQHLGDGDLAQFG